MDSVRSPELHVGSGASGAGTLALPGEPHSGLGSLLHELWHSSGASGFGLDERTFRAILLGVGERYSYGAGLGHLADDAQRIAFLRALQVRDLALARACAAGHPAAWERFFDTYRAQLTRAATAIAGSSTVGQEMADSLYGELFGLTERDGARRSPLAGYAGRGSLLGWLRTTLAQRHVDRYRRTHRESSLEGETGTGFEPAAPPAAVEPPPPELARLTDALHAVLAGLPAEGRLILASYYLDGRTLAEIGRLIGRSEATISRRVGRLADDLRAALLARLETGGMSRRQAEEALGADPRDLELNLRLALQGGASGTFSEEQGKAAPGGLERGDLGRGGSERRKEAR